MKKIIVLLILTFFVILFGCTEMSREQKNLCYSLTTQSYDFVDNCKNEGACYEEINKLFKTELGYEQESKLYELKNDLGRSWFYYNKGVEELKKVSKYCFDGNNPELPGTINQTRFYLEQAFRELDLALFNSFEITSIEEQLLTEQKIDLLKEEELYYSLIELRQILSDLETGNTKNNNYVSYYLERIQQYNASNASKKYAYLIEKDSFWINTYNIVEGAILTKIGLGKEGSFPFLSNYFYNSFSMLENIFFREESLKELQKLPAKEFMKLYSDLAGKQNSSLKRFADLFNKISKNYEKIMNEIPLFWKEVEELEKTNNSLIYEINKNKKFIFLEQELLQSQINKNVDYDLLLNQTNQSLQQLKEKKSRNSLKIGEELCELKKSINILKEIKMNLEIKKEKNILLLKEKCINEAKNIKKEKFEIDKVELNLLKQNLIFFATIVEKNNSEIFYYCEEMIKTKNVLIEGITNYEELESKKIDLTKDCFEYLEKLLPYSNQNELTFLFNQLKKEEVTNENLFYFNENCESIKRQLNNFLKDDYFVSKIIENIKSMIEEKKKLEQIQIYINDSTIKKEIEELEKKLIEYAFYYHNDEIKLENILPKKEKLLEKTTQELILLKEKNEKYVINIIEMLIKKEYLSNELPVIGNDFNLILLIKITNPFNEIFTKETFFLKIEEGLIINKPENLEKIGFGNNGFITLSGIKNGNTLIELKITQNLQIKEEEKIIYATNQSGLIQKNIFVETEKINKLLIKTQSNYEITKVIVFINDVEINNSIQKNEIYFVAENIDSKSKINVFIYTNKLIDLEKKLKQDNFLNLQSKKVEYEIIAKNLTNKNINGTIIIPTNSSEKIRQINIYDELMVNKQKELLNESIILKNQDFLGGQQRKYQLILEIDSVEEYYVEQLNEILNKLNFLNEKEVTKKIESILLIKFNEKLIKEYEMLIKEGNAKIFDLEKESKKIIDEEIKIEKVNELIEKLENDIKTAETLGLIKTKEEMQEILGQATQNLENGNANEALLILEKSVFDVDEEILSKIKSIKKEITKSEDKILNQVYFKLMEDIEKIEKTIGFEPILARETYVNVIEDYQEYLSQKRIFENEKLNSLELKQKEFDDLLKESKNLLVILEKQFDIDEKYVITTKFVFPITKSRLEKIKSTLNNFEEYNEKDLVQLQNIKQELQLAIDEIKRKTILEFNKAIDDGKESQILEQAKKEIDTNNYLKALFVLNTETSQTYFLFGIIPLVLIIFVAFILKANFSKKKKKSNALKQKVLEQWDE